MAFQNEKTEGNIHEPKNDPGKGTQTIPPNDGDLWKGREVRENVGGFTFLEGMARGDKSSDSPKMGTSFPSTAAPIWLDGMSVDENAINRAGGFGSEAQSAPMFDKFKHEENSMSDIDANQGSGSESPDKVSSTSATANDDTSPVSDEFAKFVHDPKTGSGQDYTGR